MSRVMLPLPWARGGLPLACTPRRPRASLPYPARWRASACAGPACMQAVTGSCSRGGRPWCDRHVTQNITEHSTAPAGEAAHGLDEHVRVRAGLQERGAQHPCARRKGRQRLDRAAQLGRDHVRHARVPPAPGSQPGVRSCGCGALAGRRCGSLVGEEHPSATCSARCSCAAKVRARNPCTVRHHQRSCDRAVGAAQVRAPAVGVAVAERLQRVAQARALVRVQPAQRKERPARCGRARACAARPGTGAARRRLICWRCRRRGQRRARTAAALVRVGAAAVRRGAAGLRSSARGRSLGRSPPCFGLGLRGLRRRRRGSIAVRCSRCESASGLCTERRRDRSSAEQPALGGRRRLCARARCLRAPARDAGGGQGVRLCGRAP